MMSLINWYRRRKRGKAIDWLLYDGPALWPNELESMRGMVKYYAKSTSRRERRLAGNLAKALRWIEATPQYEAYMDNVRMEGHDDLAHRGIV